MSGVADKYMQVSIRPQGSSVNINMLHIVRLDRLLSWKTRKTFIKRSDDPVSYWVFPMLTGICYNDEICYVGMPGAVNSVGVKLQLCYCNFLCARSDE